MSAKKKNSPIIQTLGESSACITPALVAQVRLLAIGLELALQPRLLFRGEPRGLRRTVGQHPQNHQAEERRRQSLHQKQPLPAGEPELACEPSSHPASEPMTTELSGSAT